MPEKEYEMGSKEVRRDIAMLTTSEMDGSEWKRFARRWCRDWAELSIECGLSKRRAKEAAELDFEKYVGQEGFTQRDMDVMEARRADRLAFAETLRTVAANVELGELTPSSKLRKEIERLTMWRPLPDEPEFVDAVVETQVVADEVVAMTVTVLKAKLDAGELDAVLDAVLEAEQAGKGRTTAVAAIEARRVELAQ